MDPLTIVLIPVCVLAVIALVVARSRARRPGGNGAGGTEVAVDPGSHSTEVTAIDRGTLLVPLPNKRNEALVMGTEHQLATLEAAGMFRESDGPSAGPLPQAIRTVLFAGGNEATRQANRGIDSGRIVALSKETMEALERNPAARDKTGKMLGLVRGKRGFTHVMRLEKSGAKAVMASNAATLAMTAAVSQQLAHIEQQLTEIRETLDEMREDTALEKLADAMGTNHELEKLAENIRRRGYMTDADQNYLAGLNLDVTQNALEADLKVSKLLSRYSADLPRHKRVKVLDELLEKKGLDYWLALRVETDLAYTRRDLLNLYWEQTHEPQALGSLVDVVRAKITERQQRMQALGRALDDLADPESRRRLDPLKQISRRRLAKRDKVVDALLAKHGEAFAGPSHDPFAVVESTGEEVLVLETGSEEPVAPGT